MLVRKEQAHSILGVPGRLNALHPWVNGVFANQSWVSSTRPVRGYGKDAVMRVFIRFDDNCRNGKMSFGITAEISIPGRNDIEAGGCLRKEIEKYFPELSPLIKWHLCSTDWPMHYIGNTVYLAGDRDYNGLRAGEVRQMRNRKTGQLRWRIVAIIDGEEKELYEVDNYYSGDVPPSSMVLKYVPWLEVGKGKERELDAARESAIWPEATDWQLMTEPEELRAMLTKRLPGLISDFRATMESIGFLWTAPVEGE